MEVHSIVALHSEEIWGDEASKREADRTHARKKKGKVNRLATEVRPTTSADITPRREKQAGSGRGSSRSRLGG